MKRRNSINLTIAILLLVLLPVFIFKEYRAFKPKKQTYQIPAESTQPRFAFSEKEEKSFVIIVFSRIDEIFSARTMQSIFDQKYPHYRVVYINIGEENQLQEAQAFIQKWPQKMTVDFIQCNKESQLREELTKVVERCKNDEIIVQLEGKDWLANEEILDKLNTAYHDPDVWLVYGQYLEYPSYRIGRNKQLPLGRSQRPWLGARLKSYYAGLVKKAQTFEGSTQDFLQPIVEIAKWHIRFVPDVLSVQDSPKKKGVGKIEESAKKTLKKWQHHLSQALGEHT